MRFLFLILLSTSAFGSEYETIETPEYLEDAVISVTLKNGKTHHFDANEWAIVNRQQKKKKPVVKWKQKQCPVCPKVEPQIKEKIVEKEVPVFKKNRISLLAGYGPIGLDTKVLGESTKVFQVEKSFGPVSGLRYTRMFGPTWSGSFEYLTNHTMAAAIGWGW